MRKNIITGVSLVALSAGMAQAGGFELQTLDTSIMYADGNSASISYASIDSSIQGENPNSATSSKKDVVKDQTVTNLAAKFDVGDSLSFGLSTYRSGAIQLDGGNEVPGGPTGVFGGNLAPTGDVNLDTAALMLKYNLNENISLIGGMTQNTLKDGNVTTLAGSYDVSGTSEQGYIVGAAYSIPEIALKAEITYQPKTEFATSASFTPSLATICGAMAPLDCTDPSNLPAFLITQTALSNDSSATDLSLPDTFAFNFQTGIAEDTLLTASYRKASWGKSQISVVPLAADPSSGVNIYTEFADSEAYSVGIGRKFTDSFSGSITYSKEEGSSSTSTSLFTVSNGSEAISVGLRYTKDNMNISAGVSQRNVGDVTVNSSVGTMQYTGNSVTSMGVKIAFTF